MKRNVLCIAITLIIIISVYLLGGCTQDPEDITVFGERIKNAESLEINVEIGMTEVEEIALSFTIKKDENKAYYSEFADQPEYYTELVGNTLYYYINRNGTWKKTQEYYYDDVDEDIVNMELFNGDNYYYDKEKRSLIMKRDAKLDFDGIYFDSLKADVGRSQCVFIGEASMDGDNYNVTLIIKNIDCTVVHVPEIL